MANSQLQRSARSLDLDAIVEHVGDASVVLIGEASHGTHEFYDMRAALTRRLIAERQFAAVVAEADWPDAYRVNRFVRGDGADSSAAAALADFRCFPAWMWRNTVIERFVTWLRQHNLQLAPDRRVGFHGMDLYGLYRSIEQVLGYLDEVDPPAALRARDRYGCFGNFGERAELHGQATGLGLTPSCEEAAVTQLLELRARGEEWLRRDGLSAIDEQFVAERYYRAMFLGRVSSWNLRDQHMLDTCEALRRHLGAHGPGHKLVVWSHNSHVGDARASEWAAVEQINLGQLMRERHGDDCKIVGFTTHTGTVTAASDWGEPAQIKQVRPSLERSWERVLHELGLPRLCLFSEDAGSALDEPRLHRAIVVVYRPETERMSHYFESRIGRQYDVLVHIDETQALQPLDAQDVDGFADDAVSVTDQPSAKRLRS